MKVISRKVRRVPVGGGLTARPVAQVLRASAVRPAPTANQSMLAFCASEITLYGYGYLTLNCDTPPAVDIDGLTGDVVCVADKIFHGLSDLRGTALALQRHMVEDPRTLSR